MIIDSVFVLAVIINCQYLLLDLVYGLYLPVLHVEIAKKIAKEMTKEMPKKMTKKMIKKMRLALAVGLYSLLLFFGQVPEPLEPVLHVENTVLQ